MFSVSLISKIPFFFVDKSQIDSFRLGTSTHTEILQIHDVRLDTEESFFFSHMITYTPALPNNRNIVPNADYLYIIQWLEAGLCVLF